MPDGMSASAAGTHGSGAMSCGSNSEISGEIKIGWGGARAGAGRKPKPSVEPAHLGPRWHVAETFPQAERVVVQDLARQGWTAYLPLKAVWRADRVIPTMRHKTVVPYMPGFVFVEFDRDGPTWGTIIAMVPGVRSILREPGTMKPAPLPPRFVADLQAGDADRLELSAVRNTPRSMGQTVEVTVGPMATFRGQVQACDGLTTTVMLSLFGRDTPVEMDWSQVRGA